MVRSPRDKLSTTKVTLNFVVQQTVPRKTNGRWKGFASAAVKYRNLPHRLCLRTAQRSKACRNTNSTRRRTTAIHLMPMKSEQKCGGRSLAMVRCETLANVQKQKKNIRTSTLFGNCTNPTPRVSLRQMQRHSGTPGTTRLIENRRLRLMLDKQTV